ncbi:unnamed protein product [Brachionus calyciflorus]|uniref:Uncharacterized protein n=1 Tax=Brachionus calyciflorus TaxID=104777 RepID=A0A814LVE1_9BILA|nr:unnamed protein product [Brachionus calyciflorus]
MFETLNEISNFHSRLRCKVDVIVEKSLIENVLEASKLNSDREILLSKIQELECFNFKNIANKKFKFGFVIENKKSIFSTHSPVFLGICNLVPTEETIKLLESGYNGYNQASINEKLSFQVFYF